MKNKAAFVTALELWAESRDRAITDLNKKAADLADQGCHDDAEYFRFVARLLTVRAIHERAHAAALQGAGGDPVLAVDGLSVPCHRRAATAS
jgi:uncharacterized metal-binding protein